ncbi:pentapeptide repeat-containing protein [Promicromonospora panici]|uniref:pentapeptide repeat-containing protein n=1 Tax=Promicromonospora panici TaxID=2219658 RepID=UPI001A92B050|nr:pentapeptide repeat-containing protein [Promicromonospora panici]
MVVIGVIAMLGALLLVLGPLTWLIAGDTVRQLSGAERAAALNDVRQTMVTAMGGGAALVAIGFTARTYYLSRRGQVTDRFGKAVAQLASGEPEERLGGLYALEQVMVESPRDHAAVVAILCAFVRRRTLLPPDERHEPMTPLDRGPLRNSDGEPDFDIDTAMTILARRPVRPEPNRPDLREVCLAQLSIRSYDFERVPRLTRMFLTASDLRRADFRGADLRGSIVNFADMQGVWLSNADLRIAAFNGANLRRANFEGARLEGAHFAMADLRDARGLTVEQISVAAINEETLLSPALARHPWVLARLSDCKLAEAKGKPWWCPPQTPDPESQGSLE